MNNIKLAISLSVALFSGTALAESHVGQGAGTDGGQVYGSQIMTQQERLQLQNRMREANTQEEREQIRLEHHEQMRERARERGVTLPEEAPAHGMGGKEGGGMGKGNSR